MSLNGLDSPDVHEAYQAAIVEPGGWFLLKYTSRDSVELLGRGKGGVVEARTEIARYSEASPLYGLLVYRRRKVLIKYLPESTSRLLQARTTVHFQDILQQYSPYETLLEIATAEGLNDTSLAAVFPLHTASPAVSSNNKLDEIGEEAEDPDGAPAKKSTSEGSRSRAQRPRKERRVDQVLRAERTPTPSRTSPVGTPTSESPAFPPSSPSTTGPPSQALPRDGSGQPSLESAEAPSAPSMTDVTVSEGSTRENDSIKGASEDVEIDSIQTKTIASQSSDPVEESASVRKLDKPGKQSMDTFAHSERSPSVYSAEHQSSFDRPSISERINSEDEPYDFSKFEYKPKIKLGPRPVAPGDKTKRPTVASISSVPATYRPTKKQESSRSKSQGPNSAVVPSGVPESSFPSPPPIPDVPVYSPRPLSRGSIKSLPSHKSTTMTPEKLRLMKAIELRKRQARKSDSHMTAPKDEDIPAVPRVPGTAEQEEFDNTAKQSDALPEQPEQPGQPQQDCLPVPEDQDATKKADSGIEMEEGQDKMQGERQDVENGSASGDQITEAQLSDHVVDEGVSTGDSPAGATEPPSVPEAPSTPTAPVAPVPETVASAEPNERQAFEDTDEGEKASTPRPKAMPSVPTLTAAEASRPTSLDGEPLERSPTKPQESTSSSQRESASSSDGYQQLERSSQQPQNDLVTRRRGIVEPIQIDGEADTTSDEDDELLRELQNAKVQQAKPMTVAKSPATEYFSRRPSADAYKQGEMAKNYRSSSIPHDKLINTEAHLSLDTTSQYLSHTTSASDDPAAGLKRNVSSGISKRIAALAEKSSRETSPSRRSSSSRSITPDANDSVQPNHDPPSNPSRWPARPRPSSYMMAARHSNRRSSFQTPAHLSQIKAPNRADTSGSQGPVSVTARIVRSGGTDRQTQAQHDAGLQESELTINRSKASPANFNLPLRDLTSDSAPSRPESAGNPLPAPNRNFSDVSRALQSAKRKSLGRLKGPQSPLSPAAEDFPPPPSARGQSTASLLSNDENATPKEGTRTSRFFSRMSMIGGGKRKSAVVTPASDKSDSPARRESVETRLANAASTDKSDMPPGVVVGDLNVQFPDTLLWKRRITSLSAHGELSFSIPQAMEHQRSSVKKFPLSDFQCPYVPDLDRQELPFSVMLDFHEGGTTLQVACGDAMTHRQVVKILVGYWKAWVGNAEGVMAK